MLSYLRVKCYLKPSKIKEALGFKHTNELQSKHVNYDTNKQIMIETNKPIIGLILLLRETHDRPGWLG